jgi:hypothetical protein
MSIYAHFYRHFMWEHPDIYSNVVSEAAKLEEEELRKLEQRVLQRHIRQIEQIQDQDIGLEILRRALEGIVKAICSTHICTPEMMRDIALHYYMTARKYVAELQTLPPDKVTTLIDEIIHKHLQK